MHGGPRNLLISHMPSRFFRRVRIAPGLTVNLSKSGASLSLGGRGAHYTLGHGRRRTTVGIPGSGMYWTTYSHRHARSAAKPRPRSARPPAAVGSGTTISDLFHKPPAQKIGWGLLYTLLVITSPIGIPLLIVGLAQLLSPTWRQRSLIHHALTPGRPPAASSALLVRAGQVHGETPELLAARAELAYRQSAWADAAGLYAKYLTSAPSDLLARVHYAHACLMAGWYDQAVAGFEQVLGMPSALDEDGRADVARSLAIAFLAKGDTEQALEVVRAQPLQRHLLTSQLGACLLLRAVCEYLLGRRARAIADLDRLYATSPATMGEVQQVKAAMEAGTFAYSLPDGRSLTAATHA